MKRFAPVRTLLASSLLLATFALTAQAQYTSNQTAGIVLGQPDFTSNTTSTTQSTFNNPQKVIYDSSSGKLFVVDTTNSRILRFTSSAILANGSAAEAVIGQTDFTTSTTSATSTTLNAPQDAVLDSSGRLWVADSGNNRVVCFPAAATVATGSATASLVFGQVDFTGNAGATSQSGMNTPVSLAFDGSGNLFVSDQGNNRVLRFNSAASQTNGVIAIPANGILGQSNYLSSTTGNSSFTLNKPAGLIVDSSSNLWVADSANNRVLRFKSAASLGNGAAASAVVGQPDLNTGNATTLGNSTLSLPTSLGVDTASRLYVSDTGNNRVLVFPASYDITIQPLALFALGQPSLTSNASSTTATGLSAPAGVSYDPTGALWISDAGNNRTLRFTTTGVTPVLLNGQGKPMIPAGGLKNFTVRIENRSTTGTSDYFKVKVNVPSTLSKRANVQYFYLDTNITKAVLAGTWITPAIAPGAKATIKLTVHAFTATTGNLNITYKATSQTISSLTASKTFTIKVKTKP